MATFDDVGARVICGGLHPDHSTVAGFVRRQSGAGAAAGVGEGLRSGGPGALEVVAGDGTKLKANAAMAANLTGSSWTPRSASWRRLDRRRVRAVGGAFPGDAAEPARPRPPDGPGPGQGGRRGTGREEEREEAGPGRGGGAAGRPRRASGRQDKEARDAPGSRSVAAGERKEAAARPGAEAAARRGPGQPPPGSASPRHAPVASQENRDVRRGRPWAGPRGQAARPPPRPPPPRPRTPKVNATDPSSLVMPLKKGGFDQLFNVQALATARTQVILAITRHPSPVDVQALRP